MSYNYINSMFGSTSTSNNGMYSLMGGTTSALGEYAMIKSGAYKKLLTAYYKKQDVSDGNDENTSTDEKVEATKLVTVKTDATALTGAADALDDTSLYMSTGKDEEGKAVYDTDKIKETVKSFVSAYNSYIDSTSEVDNTKVLRKSLGVVRETAANEKLLKQVGITIGEGNKLSVDEEKLSKAHMSTLTSLFTGRGSYASDVTQKAAETYRLAYSATFNNSNACSYTYSGAYSSMGYSSIMDKFM